MLIEKEVVFS